MSNPITFEVEVDTSTVGIEVETPSTAIETSGDARVVFAVVPGMNGEPGEQGPQGEPGVTEFEGVAWWYGSGEPSPSPVGSKPGDFYLDTVTGNVYKLGD